MTEPIKLPITFDCIPRYVATDTPEIMIESALGGWVRWEDARAAVVAERERCALVAERIRDEYDPVSARDLIHMGDEIAAAIRKG